MAFMQDRSGAAKRIMCRHGASLPRIWRMPLRVAGPPVRLCDLSVHGCVGRKRLGFAIGLDELIAPALSHG